MATIKGLVTIEGAAGVSVTYAALIANGKLEVGSYEATDEADITVRRDANGARKGYRIKDGHTALTIECVATVSTGTSRADAVKALVMPTKCSKVVIASCEASDLNGDYVYEKGAKRSFGDDWAKITIPVIKMDSESTDSLVAAVTA